MAPSPDRIVLTPEAEEDLAAFLAFLDGPETQLRSGRRCRRFPVPPVTVFHERAPGVVTVLRVHHHAREPITRE